MENLRVLIRNIENDILTLSASYIWYPHDISNGDSVFEFKIKNAIYKPEMLKETNLIIQEYNVEKGIIECWDDFSTEQYDIQGEISLTTRWFNKNETIIIIKEIERRLTEESKNVSKLRNIIVQTSHLVEEAIRRTEIKLNADKKINTIKVLNQIRESLEAR